MLTVKVTSIVVESVTATVTVGIAALVSCNVEVTVLNPVVQYKVRVY